MRVCCLAAAMFHVSLKPHTGIKPSNTNTEAFAPCKQERMKKDRGNKMRSFEYHLNSKMESNCRHKLSNHECFCARPLTKPADQDGRFCDWIFGMFLNVVIYWARLWSCSIWAFCVHKLWSQIVPHVHLLSFTRNAFFIAFKFNSVSTQVSG